LGDDLPVCELREVNGRRAMPQRADGGIPLH